MMWLRRGNLSGTPSQMSGARPPSCQLHEHCPYCIHYILVQGFRVIWFIRHQNIFTEAFSLNCLVGALFHSDQTNTIHQIFSNKLHDLLLIIVHKNFSLHRFFGLLEDKFFSEHLSNGNSWLFICLSLFLCLFCSVWQLIKNDFLCKSICQCKLTIFALHS